MNKERRRLTLDRESTPRLRQGMFYTTEQLGPKQSLTPEGYLLCEEVPLARAGEMMYGPDETPIRSSDGFSPVVIHRDIEELSKPETIASFNGKDVTNEHPEEDVGPKNYKKLSVGVLMNVRRGTGDNADLLLGDMLIKDPDTIADIRSDKREVSLGYDADYKQTGPGTGRQTNILGNHVALVERGRCGPRCAIGDQNTLSKEKDMPGIQTGAAARRRLKVADAIARVVDAAELEMKKLEGGEDMTLDDAVGEYGEDLTGEGLQHIHIHMEGSTAPAGRTGVILTDGRGRTTGTEDEFPAGPEFPEDADAGNEPGRMRAGGQDDPYEARFAAIEGSLAQIMKYLKGAAGDDGPGPGMGHGEPDGDEPGSDTQAPGASPRALDAGEDLPPEMAEQLSDEVNDAAGEVKLTKDKARKVRDSAPLSVSYQSLISDCEILAPGFRMPTFDSAQHPVNTLTAMCAARRRALDFAYMGPVGKSVIDSVARAKVFDASVLTCNQVRSTFDKAVTAMKFRNNSTHRTSDGQGSTSAPVIASNGFRLANSKVQSVEDLNELHKQFYKRK